MSKVLTVAVIGCGSRGWVYGCAMNDLPDLYKVTAICDISEERRENCKKKWEISDENIFADEKTFFEKKRADVIVIATQDRDHVRMGIRAMELGYDILLEKPISPVRQELLDLLEANKKYQRKVIVCHVLRYAPAFVKIKELIEQGEIGKLIRIEDTENVCYWHQAHSFVRGNWRNDTTTSPMIMQKCCHDLDLIQYYAGSKCKTVYSTGAIDFFNQENKPEGAADHCKDCKYIKTCPYSAENIYIEMWKNQNCPEWGWPFNVLCATMPNTEESIRKSYEESGYGKCVFSCDNNVVDNQSVDMVFENGVKVTLTMTAFTGKMGRFMVFHGSHGEIRLDEPNGTLTIHKFGQDKFGEEPIVLQISDLINNKKDEFGHGGGDAKLCASLYDMIMGKTVAGTSLEASVESHLIALSAEESRLSGKVVSVHEN